MTRTAMNEARMMIAEARDAVESTCTCVENGTDGCPTCYAIALLYKSLEVLEGEPAH